jgi:hypothetical protein
MKKVLLNPCYFGSISQWLALVTADELIFEVWDNYQKQTLRNRCDILAANGKLSLSIPVNFSQKDRQYYRDVEIANDTPWQEQHLKSMDTAYSMSPFYEYYKDELQELFLEHQTQLMAFNIKTITTIAQLLDISLSFSETTSYEKQVDGFTDLRPLSLKKALSPFDLRPYQQVFSQKFGFMSNLSILYLLFNEGPITEIFLNKHVIDK